MPTKKIAENEKRPCRDPNHHPPKHMLLTPGLYMHECPTCHNIVTFRVPSKGWEITVIAAR